MPREDIPFTFVSKHQAERLKIVFAERFGNEKGLEKWEQVKKRTTNFDELPDKIPSIKEQMDKYKKKRVNPFGKSRRHRAI